MTKAIAFFGTSGGSGLAVLSISKQLVVTTVSSLLAASLSQLTFNDTEVCQRGMEAFHGAVKGSR